jgi:alcohol dehydrogenase (cytochrome c)
MKPVLLPILLAAGCLASAQTTDAGRRQFDNRCSVCHGGDGTGGELGPPIVNRIAARNDQELASIIHDGIPNRGMPAANLNTTEMGDLIGYLRTFKPQRRAAVKIRKRITTTSGKTLEGLVLNQTTEDLQLLTDDKTVHLLRTAGESFREVTTQADWPSYNGDLSGNRFSKLDQITPANIARLAPKWIYTMDTPSPRVETTPVVVEGIMYVTNANECWALDAGNGREIWHFQRQRTKGLTGNAAGGFNRGVAWAGERVFMVTDNAHLLALNRFTGVLVWEIEMADWHQNYNATSAPLVVGDMVVTGTAGGEQGVRGFLAAYDLRTGKEMWRFWTVPKAGEPGSETWQGKSMEHGAAVAWFTGSYDAANGILYWQTGNPGPDYNDSERRGDNLYSDCILALDPKTGKLLWHYQTTPHDIADWDATEPMLLVDAAWEGKPLKLLLQANRNGFFYVFDRIEGTLLLAKPFVKKLNWAKGIGKDGRPEMIPLEKTANGGSLICPSQDGATNWYSSSYNPATGLMYVETLEKCNIYVQRPVDWQAGRGYLGGNSRPVPNEVPQKILRAIDVRTGKVVWELPQTGPANTWGGTLATATGLVLFAEDSGMFVAVDALKGTPLWRFQTSQTWRASPISYMFDNQQFIAIASGQNILAFALQ